MSTPSTVPVTPILPVTSNGLLKTNLSPMFEYVNVALAPSTVNPAPLAAAEFTAPLATVILRSETSSVVLLTVVCVPSTCKSPAITTVPVLSPTPAGSIIKFAGPAIYPFTVICPAICALPFVIKSFIAILYQRTCSC